MANQCDFVETQLSAPAQFGSNCCLGGPYFALSLHALLYTDDHDKDNGAGFHSFCFVSSSGRRHSQRSTFDIFETEIKVTSL